MSGNITPSDENTCLVEFQKKEYAIVGDTTFFTRNVEEVPPWLVELAGNTVTALNYDTQQALKQYNVNLLEALNQVNIAKNTYEEYINKMVTDEAAFVSTLSTLNSSIQNNDASIRNLLQTYATQEFVTSTVATALNASLNGGAIGAAINNAESVMATQYGAMAQRLDTLESTFIDNANQQQAEARAIQALETYTGIGTVNGLPAVIANSSFYKNLEAYLQGTNYSIGGSNTLINYVQATSTEAAKNVESKFEYGSTLTINGRQYRAGFGLKQLGTVLPDGTTYDSEFWVNANKFVFVDGTTQSKPFRIENGITYIQNAKVEDLSALSANMGTITAGKMQSSDGRFVIDLTNKFIRISV